PRSAGWLTYPGSGDTLGDPSSLAPSAVRANRNSSIQSGGGSTGNRGRRVASGTCSQSGTRSQSRPSVMDITVPSIRRPLGPRSPPPRPDPLRPVPGCPDRRGERSPRPRAVVWLPGVRQRLPVHGQHGVAGGHVRVGHPAQHGAAALLDPILLEDHIEAEPHLVPPG